MFGWFKKKSLPDVYMPKERRIYSFWDGQTMRRVDPLPLYKAIMAKSQSLSIDMQVASSPLKDNVKAHDNYIKDLQTIFGLKLFEKGGLLENEVEELFLHFWTWQGLVKNASSPTQTIATEALPSTESSSGENQPMPNGLGSTLTTEEKAIDNLTPLPPASELPLDSATPELSTAER